MAVFLQRNFKKVNEDIVTTLVDFIVFNSRVHNVFNFRTQKTFSACIDLYQTVLLFGMEPYTKGLRKANLDENYNQEITPYSVLDKLVQLPTTNPCYVALVHKFEGLMFIGELDSDKDWATWLGEHPTFVACMESWKTEREAQATINRETCHAARWEKSFPVLVQGSRV
ncbi:uncharacterized protein CC84DRAFT_1234847 [Paraphaeosphaeria sporulosa]|uniref:Uncharacterized protein n=1 Tax=Paraphaeosphaeria sporulosa TaxID=1460663 RepID=A0A177CPF2_9PLEO|nr:uncharacterized protein CC84DRAFT_1234847 [Paraphaeosphaeria sporulosa]OAG09394.1 hypothetical protein CC84DRAFT_1234847 [Paraphaeosphaeria sporulosa]